MKAKLIVLLVFVACLPGIARAQDEAYKLRFTGGPVVEMNLSKYALSRNAGPKSYMNVGATAGGFLQLDASHHFAIRANVLFHYKSSYLQWQGRNNINYWGEEIAIYALYAWNPGNGHRIYLGGGPYTEFGFSAVAYMADGKIDLYAINEENEVSAMRNSNTGFGVTAGYELPCGLQINMGYKISVSNALDANSNLIGFYPMAASVGVAYRFGK